MLEAITPYATIISAGSALISTVAVLISTWFIIWTTCFRKTRRDKIDELKVEMQILFYQITDEGILGISDSNYRNDLDEHFQQLKPKFQKPEYKVLQHCAFAELVGEDKVHIAPIALMK